MKYLLFLTVFLVLGCEDDPTTPGDDNNEPAWATYTEADGLPHGAVTGLEVASDGSLWFNHAIEGGGGVTHFDGATFTHHDENNGLPTNLVLWYRAIATQPNGDVWIGTHGSGVMQFDGENWTTHTMANGLGGDSVVAVTVAANGDVWCVGDAISRYSGEEWNSWPLDPFGLAPFALCVGVCADGEVWVGGTQMACYDGEDWTFREHAIPEGPATAVAIAPNGHVWVGGFGITRFDGENRRHFSAQEMGLGPFGEYGIGSIAIDDDGIVWAATSGQGVVRYDGTEWTQLTKADGLLDDMTFSVAIDHQGAMWVGSMDGLSRYMPTKRN